MHLEVAQITLCLVVVEGNRQIVEEGEHLVLLQQESFEQVARRCLFEPTALASTARLAGGVDWPPVPL